MPNEERDEIMEKIEAELLAWNALPQEEKKRINEEHYLRVNEAILRREAQSSRNRMDYFRDELDGDKRVG